MTEGSRGNLNSVETIMARTTLGRTKVYELIKTGELRSVKIGSRRMVTDEALDDLIRRLEAS